MIHGGMMFTKGDIVIISFPFSDLVNAKKRPMLILGMKGEDLIGCAITSNPESEGILLDDFSEAKLPFESKVKYWQIHTFLKSLALKKVAKVSKKKHKEILRHIEDFFKV